MVTLRVEPVTSRRTELFMNAAPKNTSSDMVGVPVGDQLPEDQPWPPPVSFQVLFAASASRGRAIDIATTSSNTIFRSRGREKPLPTTVGTTLVTVLA